MTWPWGNGKHGEPVGGVSARSSLCDSCHEWCFRPYEGSYYQHLCRCCKEPLYQLKIAELEAGVERLKQAQNSESQGGLPPDMEWIWDDECDAYAIYGDRWDYFYRPSNSTYWAAFKGFAGPCKRVIDRDHAERIIRVLEEGED